MFRQDWILVSISFSLLVALQVPRVRSCCYLDSTKIIYKLLTELVESLAATDLRLMTTSVRSEYVPMVYPFRAYFVAKKNATCLATVARVTASGTGKRHLWSEIDNIIL